MRHRKTLLTAFVAIAATSAAASASSLPISAVLYNTGDTPAGVSPGTTDLSVQFGGTMISNAYVGQLNWHSAGPANAITPELQSVIDPSTGNFSTYCIEGTEDVFFGQQATWADGMVNMDSAPDTSTPAGGLIPSPPHFTSQQISDLTEFWNRFHDDVTAAPPSGFTNDELGAAFQLGIWEIVYDDVSGVAADISANPTGVFGKGVFQAGGDTTITGLAQSWLAQVSGTFNNQYTLFALTGPGTQDQIFGVLPSAVTTGGTPPTVPLPAALPAGLALMSGLGITKYLRRRS